MGHGRLIQATAVAGVVTVCLLGGCRFDDTAGLADTAAARAAAERWMKLVDDGHYEESWTQASQRLQSSVSRRGWADGVREHHGRLGALLSRALVKEEYAPQFNIGDGIVADCARFVFEESYERKASARHTVAVMREADGVWRVYMSVL